MRRRRRPYPPRKPDFLFVAQKLPPSRSAQWLKGLACLAVATVFWVMNALNRDNYSLNVQFPLRFVYNDTLFVPTTPLPRTVTANVSGDGWGLLGHSWLPFRTESVNYEVKNPLQASVISPASLAASLSEQIKHLRVNYVVADTLALGFERRLVKTIRLVPDSTHINLAPRMVVSSVINLTPATIQVEGPERIVRGFSDTLVVRIPGKRISVDYDDEVPINNYRHPLVRSSTNRVAVSFEVAELLSIPEEPPLPPVQAPPKPVEKKPVKATKSTKKRR